MWYKIVRISIWVEYPKNNEVNKHPVNDELTFWLSHCSCVEQMKSKINDTTTIPKVDTWIRE